MKKVRITVLKRELYPDLAEQYARPGLGICPLHEDNQVFVSEGGGKPEELCNDAWRAFQHYVLALSAGADNFYDGRWLKDNHVVISSCPDGFRPVVFKLEALEG